MILYCFGLPCPEVVLQTVFRHIFYQIVSVNHTGLTSCIVIGWLFWRSYCVVTGDINCGRWKFDSNCLLRFGIIIIFHIYVHSKHRKIYYTIIDFNMKIHASQGCSGARTRRNAIPTNNFEQERRTGKYRYHSRNADTAAFRQIISNYKSYLIHEIWPIGSQKNH